MVVLMFDFNKVKVIVKTRRGYENIVATLIEDLIPDSKTLPKPLNYSGIVLVISDREDAGKIIENNIPEAEKILPVRVATVADIDAILRNLDSIIEDIDGPFAVRTTRRGRHSFSSIDVNVAVGEIIKNRTGQSVNLDFPHKVVFVEIIDKYAYLGVVDAQIFPKKRSKEKIEIRNFFQKVSIVQIPYLGKSPAPREMGVRVGREAQTFEVKEFVVAPVGLCEAKELKEFIDGVYQGIETRFQIQKKVYSHKPRRVKVYVQNLYELIRERKDENIVVFEPEGRPISKVSRELAEMVIEGKRTNFLIGSREGIPTGVYRFADLVIDLCPGITIATDSAISSAMMALSFSLQKSLERSAEIP